jgi:nicotinamidase/pyrazinamidase
MELGRDTALIVVDVQRDFLPGGALPVPRGGEIVPAVNRLSEGFHAHGLTVVYTRCWLPADHTSFHGQGGRLEPYCVQDTQGAEFADDLQIPEGVWIISKGTHRDQDVLSGFRNTGLGEKLREAGIEQLLVCGLSTEIAIKNTVLDALESGFEVILVADACRGFNRQIADSARAVEEMLRHSARIASSGAVQNALEAYSATG